MKFLKKCKALRPAILCLLLFTLLCGVLYPLSVTLLGQTMFPYEANGSQITVTIDGQQRVVGSKYIGQAYDDLIYMAGRVNGGAPSNLDPTGEEYQNLLEERIRMRKEQLALIGYTEDRVPMELITESGSGCDPHISPEVAEHQVPILVQARKVAGWKLWQGNIPVAPDKVSNYAQEELSDYTQDFVREIVQKYTEGRFLGFLGEKTVNVLYVNLALDGLL